MSRQGSSAVWHPWRRIVLWTRWSRDRSLLCLWQLRKMAWRCGCVDGCETGSHSKRRAKCPLSLSCILFLLRWVHSCTQSPEEDCTASLMWTNPKPCSSDSKIAYLTHVSFYLHNSLTANFSCWSIWNWECINLDWYSFFYSSPLFSHVASSNSHIWGFSQFYSWSFSNWRPFPIVDWICLLGLLFRPGTKEQRDSSLIMHLLPICCCQRPGGEHLWFKYL